MTKNSIFFIELDTHKAFFDVAHELESRDEQVIHDGRIFSANQCGFNGRRLSIQTLSYHASHSAMPLLSSADAVHWVSYKHRTNDRIYRYENFNQLAE